jgi:glycosyltransferase involved in cell wall biosynthesis
MCGIAGILRSAAMNSDAMISSDPSALAPAARKPLRVCFLRSAAYGLFDPTSPTVFGGAEVRSFLMATGLAAQPEFAVSFLVADEGQPGRQQFGNVCVCVLVRSFFERVYQGYRKSIDPVPTFPWIRLRTFRFALMWQLPLLLFHRVFIHGWAKGRPRQPRVRRFYRDLGVDVFCCFGANEETADVIATCKKFGGRVILFLIHDAEVAELNRSANVLNPTTLVLSDIIRFGLTQADHVVAQTTYQVDQLARHYGRHAALIRNPVDLSRPPRAVGSSRGAYALWIGRAGEPDVIHKRPELCWALARQCPEVPVLAVLNASSPVQFAQLLADKPANVRVVQRVPYAESAELYRQAAVFLNTSASEGFPNTFLQAAAHGVPVLSLSVDPDGMLARHGAGIACAGDLEHMAGELRRLWADSAEAARLGQLARAYVEREHDLQLSVGRLANLLRDVAGKASQTSPVDAPRQPEAP